MITNEQLTFCMQQLYPGTANGQDYWIGHPVDANGKQMAPAAIFRWGRADLRAPAPSEIASLWAQYESAFHSMKADRAARDRRETMLKEADMLVERAADAGLDQMPFRRYRQALRDITAQPGFPFDVEWPEAPVT
ncbi:phage tail assembly chaperone [Burkholderia mayonis]|nr:phage tail assembly chaperone [Burkholderia mayonis]